VAGEAAVFEKLQGGEGFGLRLGASDGRENEEDCGETMPEAKQSDHLTGELAQFAGAVSRQDGPSPQWREVGDSTWAISLGSIPEKRGNLMGGWLE
jgi:hypothetical protein